MIEINDKFKHLFNEETRYYIITGERMASKSFTVNFWATLKLLEKNNTILFTRFTLVSAKDSIIPEFNEKIDILGLNDFLDVQTHDITNKSNSSNILFRGIKTSQGVQTAKLKSLRGVNIWIVDEAEELTEEAIFDKIDLSVRTKGVKNMIILIMNPAPRTHWIYKRFFKNVVPEDFNGINNDVTYIYTTLKDNIKNIDPALAEQLLKLKKDNPQDYKKRMSTSWMDQSDEIVFNYSQLKWFDKVDYSNAEIFAYCDVADQGIDYLCFIVGALIGDNVFILDVIYTRQDSTYTIPKIASLYTKYNIQKSIFESNNQGLMFLKLLWEQFPHTRNFSDALPNSSNKHSRIIAQSQTILNTFHFKNTQDKMYSDYIDYLTQYKNDKSFKVDDAPDAPAGLSKVIVAMK